MDDEGVFICKFGDNFRLCRVKAQDLAVIGNTKDFDDLDDAFAEAKVIISYEKKPFKAIIRYGFHIDSQSTHFNPNVFFVIK